ncbi:hypothetical protein K2P97_07030 [bacterium]|nr:hypothetical protein [bacterium]
MNKLLVSVSLLFLFSCTNMPYRKIASAPMCQYVEDLPPLFNVIENNQTQIVVDLGPFGEFFKLRDNQYNYQVIFRGSKENKEDKNQLVQKGSSDKNSLRLTVPVKKTGVYYFTIYQDEDSPVWKQKVFAIAPTEKLLNDADKAELAAKYAPVVSYHDDEQYFPVSLEYLTNQVDRDENLAEEPFRLVNKKQKSLLSFFSKPSLDITFEFKDILKVLPYYGHSESVLKSGLSSSSATRLKQRYGDRHATVYYSVFENPKWKEIYINYHFFYTYDPKNGTADKDALPAHIFDRESMTVVLRSTTRQPLSVFYGAHLASQTMGQLSRDGDVLQRWESGRVFVNWPLVKKIGNHPIPAVALGSHGIYPKAGNYAVLLNNIKLLLEPAGGKRILYPEFMNDFQRTPTSYSYALKDLKLETVTSDCRNPNNVLAFSGSTVDVLGPVNASFPPFTDREEDYFSYADPNAPMFEMDLDK